MSAEVLHAPSKNTTVPAGAVTSACATNEQKATDQAIKEKIQPNFLLQPKLTVGAPDDPYEKEADAVADKVMRMPERNTVQRQTAGADNEEMLQTKSFGYSLIQRACTAFEKEKIQRQATDTKEEEVQPKLQDGPSFIQRKCEECKKEEEKPLPVSGPSFIQAKSMGGTGVVSDSLHQSIQNSRGGGSQMDSATQSFMGSRMGADFRHVKIHADTNAARSNREISARAFTVGSDIYFNEAQYQPHTEDGKRLLAHELTHVIQQGRATVQNNIYRKEQAPFTAGSSVCGQYAPAPVINVAAPATTTDTSAPVRPSVPSPGAVPAGNGKMQAGGTVSKTISPALKVNAPAPDSKPVSATAADPAFKSVIKDTRKQAKQQKDHELPGKKMSDAQGAVNVSDPAAIKSGATVLAVEENVNTANQPSKTFDANKFKEDLKRKITEQVPQEEKGAREFIKDDSKVNNIVDETKTGIKTSEKNVVGDAEQISNKESAGAAKQQEIFTGPNISYTQEAAGKAPVVHDPGRAVPKPLEDEEVKMDEEHDADSLDRKMRESQLTDNQLAESEEPEFLETLETKQQSQKELCQVPATMRQAEAQQMLGDTKDAQQLIGGTMGAMFGKRDGQLGEVGKGQQHVQSDEEKQLQQYYNQVKLIYETTEANVKSKLDYLECMVACTFQDAIDGAFTIFKANVSSRLDYYYDWHIVNPDYEKEDKMTRAFVNAPIQEKINALTYKKYLHAPGSPARVAIEQDILRLTNSKAKLRIERIFEEEKALFISSLDMCIDNISIMIAGGLNDAKALISKGRTAMDTEFEKLGTANKEKATEATKDFESKFKDLEDRVDEKENDLSDGLVKQYTESVDKLKSTFEDIRKEAAMSWWEKAWRKIKEIATIIFDIAKLLLNVLVKAASVIGDIVAHPIRFFGNLINGVATGFKNFVKRLPEHLEAIIFKLVMGVVPPDISLPEKWDAKGIFSFVLEFFGLSKKNIRDQAIIRFGEPIVQKLEEGFELFVLFRNEGFAGLWEHIKEKVGDMKDAIIEEVKTFFKESIIKAAIEFLLSALTPASGFIKVCKSIINVVMFFVKNLQNILKLLDSILDSMADIVLGKIDKAAGKVEQALADILLVGIKFLAALVGINLDKIQAKISKIINAVRNPINRALAWFFDKAEAFARKTGLLAVIKKGQEKFAAGKDWAKGKVEKVKEKVKSVIGDWLNIRKKFDTKYGESHTLFIEEQNGIMVLMLASKKMTYLKKVQAIAVDPSNHELVSVKADAEKTAKSIDQILKNKRKDESDAERKKHTADLGTLINKLGELTAQIMPPETEKKNLVVNKGDVIQIKKGKGKTPARVTGVDANYIMFETIAIRQKLTGQILIGELEKSWWRGSEASLELAWEVLEAENLKEKWGSMKTARAVLNWRRSTQQRNRDADKQWEHKIENRTQMENIHSSHNLYWTDADFNHWMGIEMGKPARIELLTGSTLRRVSYREYLDAHDNEKTHLLIKEILYKERKYKEVSHEVSEDNPRGRWQSLMK